MESLYIFSLSFFIIFLIARIVKVNNLTKILSIAGSINIIILSTLIYSYGLYYEKLTDAGTIVKAVSDNIFYKAFALLVIFFNIFYLLLEGINFVYERREQQ